MQLHIKFMLLIIIWVMNLTPLSTILQSYRVGRLIGGGNRTTRGKPPSCLTPLSSFIT